MANIVSNAVTGNASSGSSWVGGVVPGIGDTAEIVNGAVITVDINMTIGTSPASTAGNIGVSGFDVTVDTGGALIVAAGIKLSVRGNLGVGNSTLTLQAGSTLEFDASHSAAPATTYYYLQLGTAANQTASKLLCSGTSGSHVTIQSVVTGGAAQGQIFASLKNNCGIFDLTYVDFVKFGQGDLGGGAQFYGSVVAGNSEVTNSFHHCTWDGPSFHLTFQNSLTAATGLTIQDCVFNMTTDQGLRIVGGVAGNMGVLRELLRNVFNVTADVPRLVAEGFTFTDNYFQTAPAFPSSTAAWVSYLGNFLNDIFQNADGCFGDVQDCYLLKNNDLGNNHGFTPTVDNCRVHGCVKETTGSSHIAPDEFVLSGVRRSGIQIDHNILLPGGGDGAGSCIANFGGGVTGDGVNIYHNTVCASNDVCLIGDYGDPANTYANYESNIAWFPSAGGSLHVHDIVSPGTTDAMTTGNFNCGWNLAAGRSGKGYDSTFSVTPGANDVVLSGGTGPNFVDRTRNIATWAVTRGSGSGTYAGQVADALTFLKADPTLTRSSLIPYIRAGFAPQNAALHNTGHDGTDIGAVAFVAAFQPAWGVQSTKTVLGGVSVA